MLSDILYHSDMVAELPESTAPAQLLTPENCHSSSRIRAFLRLSRIATDDTIRQHLNEIKPNQCDTYASQKIFPQWKARAAAIQFCTNYSLKLRKETIDGKTQNDSNTTTEFNLRLDPYAYKSYKQQIDNQFAQCDAIDNWVHNENTIEKIVREQTTEVLNDKCYYKDWLAEFRKRANSRS